MIPELKTIATQLTISIGQIINIIADQADKQGAQENGLKFKPKETCRLFIIKKTAKQTDANIVIIFLYYKFLLLFVSNGPYRPHLNFVAIPIHTYIKQVQMKRLCHYKSNVNL